MASTLALNIFLCIHLSVIFFLSIFQFFKDVVERVSLSLSRLGLFFRVSRQVVETAAGADLRIKSLKGGGAGGITV